jgi:hypothetical protein
MFFEEMAAVDDDDEEDDVDVSFVSLITLRRSAACRGSVQPLAWHTAAGAPLHAATGTLDACI